MGALLVLTGFDARQNVAVDDLIGSVSKIKTTATDWDDGKTTPEPPTATLQKQSQAVIERAEKLRAHLEKQLQDRPQQAEHLGRLLESTDVIRSKAADLQNRRVALAGKPLDLVAEAEAMANETTVLKQQTFPLAAV
jgi:hypothetical protein